MLPDGTYHAIVIDADGGGEPDTMLLSLTIISGAAKGEVVDVRAVPLQYEPLDLLAMPCILVVASGEPKVVFD